MKKLAMRKRIIYIGLTLILTTILIEAALQIFCLASKRIYYALHPWDTPERYLNDERLRLRGNPALPEHDRLGFRNTTVPTKVDIVTIGDSNTYGDECRPDEAWPIVLSRLSRVSVYNMGSGGWGPIQFREVLPSALEFSPKLVIICIYFGNDLLDSYNMAYNYPLGADLQNINKKYEFLTLEEQKPLSTLWNKMLSYKNETSLPTSSPGMIKKLVKEVSSRSQLAALIRALRLVLLQRDQYGARNAMVNDMQQREKQWAYWKSVVSKHPDILSIYEGGDVRTVLTIPRMLALMSDLRCYEGVQVLFRALKNIMDHCERTNTELLITLLPTKDLVFSSFLNTAEYGGLQELVNHETKVRNQVIEYLGQNDIHFVDSLPALCELIRKGKNPYFESDNTHINALGQIAIAETVRLHPFVTQLRRSD